MIEIDGVQYNVNWAEGFESSFEILNGQNTGRLQNSGDMFLDPIGTFFNFSGTIVQSPQCSLDEWDNLLMTLANPLSEHTVIVPFNQGVMEWQFYVSSGKRSLKRITSENRWARTIDVKLIAMRSQWSAGGRLQGYTKGVLG